MDELAAAKFARSICMLAMIVLFKTETCFVVKRLQREKIRTETEVKRRYEFGMACGMTCGMA